MKTGTEESKDQEKINGQAESKEVQQVQMSPEEAFEFQRMKARKEAYKKCEEEIKAICEKYNALIVPDLESPLGNPAVKIILKN